MPTRSVGGTLEVGEGKAYARIEEAVGLAEPGDTVLVYPLPEGRPYRRTAAYVSTPRLTIRGVQGASKTRVHISGAGFDYSGRGDVPRAIFQFNADADGCTLEGFELSGAHNGSHNGAGVRINQANDVTVRNCEIHANDMGIMSNGDGTDAAAAQQLIESCEIHHNGNFEHPGYNHNLYLGGWSVTVRFCDIHDSLTGHNLKSRAHENRVEYSFIHDSGNREMDLVDGGDTEADASHTFVVGTVIAKDPRCRGNKNVIHFGQDGGRQHNGTLFLLHSTIVTPFLSPVVHLSSAGASVYAYGSIVWNRDAFGESQVFADVRAGGRIEAVDGSANWISNTFDLNGTGLMDGYATPDGFLPFADPANHNYRLFGPVENIIDAAGYEGLPDVVKRTYASSDYLQWEYATPLSRSKRYVDPPLDAGAHEYKSTRHPHGD